MKKGLLPAVLTVLMLVFFQAHSGFAENTKETEIQKESRTPFEIKEAAPDADTAKGRIFYVRQTAGNDANDGLSPKTAWQRISRLSTIMNAGDTAYIGPGLYRDEIAVQNSGTAGKRITFIADATGEHTGDPPGAVMITGAEPVDETIFTPDIKNGVFKAAFKAFHVVGMTEMDGDQYRYEKATITREYLVEKKSEVEVVAAKPGTYFYDQNSKILYIHTSDSKHPKEHEIELFRRGNGISMAGKHYITIKGFTFRHMGDAGIGFWRGSSNGVAVNNTSYGSRQGIRVYSSKDISVEGNILFRNENSGVYFASESSGGRAVNNICFENTKGIRLSSKSIDGALTGNIVFDNRERGISVEHVQSSILRQNTLVNNRNSQLFVLESEVDSDDNCFENRMPEQFTADFFFLDISRSHRYKTLAEYQKDRSKESKSREGSCSGLPKKIDVRKLHEETMTYTERALKILHNNKTLTDKK